MRCDPDRVDAGRRRSEDPPDHRSTDGAIDRAVHGTDEPPEVHALDIETDTTDDGLDPRVSRVVAVAVASRDGEVVFDDADENELLGRLDRHLAVLGPGVLATWNGAAFDLPFLADRAATAGATIALRLAADPAWRVRDPLPGHSGAYRATWYGLAHLDAYRVFRADVAPALRMSCSLKTIARLVGLQPVTVDAGHLHLLDDDALRAYVASDARCTRALVLRRWPSMRGAVDRVDPPAIPAAARPRTLAAPAASVTDSGAS
jgi:hypothetical protein